MRCWTYVVAGMAQLMEFLSEGSKAGRVENVTRYHVAPSFFLHAISMWISSWFLQVSRNSVCDHFFLAKLAFATGVEDNPLMEGACFCVCGAWVGDFMVTLMLVNQCLPDIPHKQRVTMGYEPPSSHKQGCLFKVFFVETEHTIGTRG